MEILLQIFYLILVVLMQTLMAAAFLGFVYSFLDPYRLKARYIPLVAFLFVMSPATIIYFVLPRITAFDHAIPFYVVPVLTLVFLLQGFVNYAGQFQRSLVKQREKVRRKRATLEAIRTKAHLSPMEMGNLVGRKARGGEDLEAPGAQALANAIERYNIRVQAFPGGIIARLLGFHRMDY